MQRFYVLFRIKNANACDASRAKYCNIFEQFDGKIIERQNYENRDRDSVCTSTV